MKLSSHGSDASSWVASVSKKFVNRLLWAANFLLPWCDLPSYRVLQERSNHATLVCFNKMSPSSKKPKCIGLIVFPHHPYFANEAPINFLFHYSLSLSRSLSECKEKTSVNVHRSLSKCVQVWWVNLALKVEGEEEVEGEWQNRLDERCKELDRSNIEGARRLFSCLRSRVRRRLRFKGTQRVDSARNQYSPYNNIVLMACFFAQPSIQSDCMQSIDCGGSISFPPYYRVQ